MGVSVPLRGSPIVARRSAPDPLGVRAMGVGTSALMVLVPVPAENDPIGAIAALICMACCIYAGVAHLSLIGELKRKGVELDVMLWGSHIFFLQFEYLKRRDEIGDSKMDSLARSALVAPFIGLAAVLAAFVIWPGRP